MQPITNLWPLQRNCVAFYGDPMGAGFEAKNIVRVPVPFKLKYGSSPKSSVKAHRKCADILEEWLSEVWRNAERKQWVVDAWGISSFSGDFVVRQKRAGSTLSMHAFGCAWDFDAARNGFKDKTPHFATPGIIENVVVPFEKLGGVWGGRWPNNTDGMHFQFARVA